MDIIRKTISISSLWSRLSSLAAKESCAYRLQSAAQRCCVHTSTVHRGLEEFFEEDINWDQVNVKAGRPWRREDLRGKSNQDLHRLWYVLLKERNLLFTMEHLAESENEAFKSPDRIFKVEESMLNILSVVKERNEAYEKLEQGVGNHTPKTRIVRNAVGIPINKRIKEHAKPEHASRHYQRLYPQHAKWMDKNLTLYEEKLRKQRNREYFKYRVEKEKLMEEFDLTEDEIPEFEPKQKELQKHLNRMAQLHDHQEK